MASAYDKLRRILSLEREQGCTDRAVIGGLSRFLTYWEGQAREEAESNTPSLPLQEVIDTLAGYADMSVEARTERIDHLLEKLGAREDAQPVATSLDTPHSAQPTRSQPNHSENPTPTDEGAHAAATPTKTRHSETENGFSLGSPILKLKGVGATNQKHLARLGVETIKDLLY